MNCPYCNEYNDSLTGTSKLEAGGLCICIKCQEVSVLLADLSQRKMTDEEWESLDSDTANQIIDYQTALRDVKNKLGYS